MKIGVVPNLNRAVGGSYQYAVTMVRALAELDLPGDEIVLFLYAGESLPEDLAGVRFPSEELRTVTGLTASLWGPIARRLSPGTRTRLRRLAGGRAPATGTVADDSAAGGAGGARWPLLDPLWKRWFDDRGVELLIFTNENDLAFLTGVPYIVAIHDLQHRLHPEFAEVSDDGEGDRREYSVGNCVREAALVLVDSEVGKDDMLTYYGGEGVSEADIGVLPFLPADYMGIDVSDQERRRVHAVWDLPERYFFYPSQFAPSKNHLRLIEALALLRSRAGEVSLILGGSHSGALREETFAGVWEAADRLGVTDLVRYLGYIPDEDMPALYAESLGLAMPTFFGSTNIPILEAWAVGAPVLTSDIRGVADQAGDAAVLVDPESVDSIAAGLAVLLDPEKARELAQKGRARLASYTRDEYLRRLSGFLAKARQKIQSGRDARMGG